MEKKDFWMYTHRQSNYNMDPVRLLNLQLFAEDWRWLRTILGILTNNTMTEQDRNVVDQDQLTWNTISWKMVDRDVARIRRRIFKASKAKDYKSLRNLQKLAMASFSVVLYCVRKVTQKFSGKKTPGVDNITYLTNIKRYELATEIHSMKFNQWKPNLIKRHYIPKTDGRRHPLGIPIIKDRVLQAIVVVALEPEWEAIFEPSSYGFRPGKSYQDAVHRIFTLLSKKDRLWILDADIKGCFDNIDHHYLLNCLKGFPQIDLIRNWLKAGILENNTVTISSIGTPQGGVISPLLCNIALHGLEDDLGILYDSQGYIPKCVNPFRRTLVRYADDFIVICPTKEIALRSKIDISTSLIRRGLTLNEDKTKIAHSFDGFDFLGFNFRHRLKDGYKHVNIGDTDNGVHPDYMKYVSTIVTPSNNSVISFRLKLSEIFANHRGKSATQLISSLNPIIRGYCESKRTWSFSHAYSSIGQHLFKLQLRWIKRTHPKKSISWCVNRYFIHYKTAKINSRWTFRDPITGIVCYKPLWYGTSRVWPPVVGSYSPDNPDLREYWQERAHKLFACRVVDLFSNMDYWLVSSQNLICPVCEESLFNGDPLHRHHVLPTFMGGKNNLKNLVIVHMQCHHHIHYGNKLEHWITLLKVFKEKTTINQSEKNLSYTDPAD